MTVSLAMRARERTGRLPRAGVTVAVLLTFLSACSGEDAQSRDSTQAPPSAARSADSATAVATAPDTTGKAAATCVSEGAWRACSVEKRLTDAGFVPVKQDAPAADLFPLQGIQYALGPARLHVYVFESAKARESAVATIDTIAIAARGKPATWAAPAWLITSNNLVAVLVSDNGRLVERVQLALTAGLPSAAH